MHVTELAWSVFFRLLFGPGKLFCVYRIYIQDQSLNNFENDTMKLSVHEAKLTGL